SSLSRYTSTWRHTQEGVQESPTPSRRIRYGFGRTAALANSRASGYVRASPLVDRIHDYPAVFDPCEVEIVHERLRQHFRRRHVSCDVEHHDLEIATHTPLRAPQYVGDHVFGRYLVEAPSGVLHPALRQLWVQAPAHPVNITIEPGLDVISADTPDRFDVGRHPRGTQGTSLRAGHGGTRSLDKRRRARATQASKAS